jgi:hypothetical protein
LTVPLSVTVVVPGEPAVPVVTDGPAVGARFALSVVAPAKAPEVLVDELPDAPVDDEGGHPSAWSEAKVDCAFCRLV